MKKWLSEVKDFFGVLVFYLGIMFLCHDKKDNEGMPFDDNWYKRRALIAYPKDGVYSTSDGRPEVWLKDNHTLSRASEEEGAQAFMEDTLAFMEKLFRNMWRLIWVGIIAALTLALIDT